MARPESVASGHYIPTQADLYDAIASIVRVSFPSTESHLVVADPCAGEGFALKELARRFVERSFCPSADEDDAWPGNDWNDHARLFGCEMEQHRFAKLNALSFGKTISRQNSNNTVVHGDAFLLTNASNEGAHILWLNPPYDHDKNHGGEDHKRLEHRWLSRFWPLVAMDGLLMFYVPFRAIGLSADILAQNFEMPVCYRVPEPFWSAYQQVVLVARRRLPLATPDPRVAAQIRAWSANAALIPGLPLAGLDTPARTVVAAEVKLPSWKMGALDLADLLSGYKPWTTTGRTGRSTQLTTFEPTDPYTEILAPRLHLACAPRPSHIAIAAGAGVLSGARLSPDAGCIGPDLLLKGVHRRVLKHKGWKEVKGERVGEEQQHHPELQLSILDLGTGRYHTLVSSVDPSGSEDLAKWTVGDLLARYSGGMLAAMRAQCDLLYDPTRPSDTARLLLPISPDPLLAGQEDGVRGLLRLLQQPDRAAILLGEIGVGKTRISLTTAAFHLGGRGRILVTCPTHLVPEWESEVAKVLPEAKTYVLVTIEDIDTFAAASSGEGIHVALMSKEMAKLGHAWEGISICPTCGARAEEQKDKIAARRGRCSATTTFPLNDAARVARRLALGIGGVFPDPQLQHVVHKVGGRILRNVGGQKGDWRERASHVRAILPMLRRMIARAKTEETRNGIFYAWLSALHAAASDKRIVREVRALFRSTLADRHNSSEDTKKVRHIAARALLLLPPSSPWIATTIAEMESYEGLNHWHKWTQLFDDNEIVRTTLARREGRTVYGHELALFTEEDDVQAWSGRPRGSDAALTFAIERVTSLARWGESEACGEALFQAVPKPRRVPLSTYILKRHPKLFDFMLIDECHVFGHGDSAQSRAAQQFLSLCMRRKVPVVALTGSVMNGYARSLFVLLWHLSSAFRAEFAYNQVDEFERRYGFLVTVTEQFDEKKNRVVFGKQSDRRVTERSRTVGPAPGVLPAVILKYLLPISITVQLSDLEQALPPCHEEVVFVRPTKAQRLRATSLEERLLKTIGRDRFKAGLAGKLFGALGHLPRYYDHATSDVGNGEDGAWTIAYPEDTNTFDRVVAMESGFDPTTRLPKEKKLVERLRTALAEGRNVVVAVTRTRLAQRLARVIREDLDIEPALLDAKKVKATERREWIAGVRARGARVVLCNPAALPTGLNNLVGYFTAVCIYDDPNSDPTLLRQFRGRFVRIGQTDPVDLWIFVYANTLQEDASELLQQKRIVATAADGLDASAAFEVAGVGEQSTFENDLGKALYARLIAKGETHADVDLQEEASA